MFLNVGSFSYLPTFCNSSLFLGGNDRIAIELAPHIASGWELLRRGRTQEDRAASWTRFELLQVPAASYHIGFSTD